MLLIQADFKCLGIHMFEAHCSVILLHTAVTPADTAYGLANAKVRLNGWIRWTHRLRCSNVRTRKVHV